MNRKLLVLAIAALPFGILVGNAAAEDGGPTLERPAWCTSSNTTTYGSGNNTFNGSNNADCAIMDGGSDHAYGWGDHDWFNGGDQTDYLYGYDGGDLVYGGRQGDLIQGNAGNDYIYGGCVGGCDQTGESVHDDLSGNGGNDTIGAQDGWYDVVHGGSGTDVCYVDRNLDSWDGCEEVHLG